MLKIRSCGPSNMGLLLLSCWVLLIPGLSCAAHAVEENPEETMAEESIQFDPALEPLVTMAREDLAERLEITVEESEVLEAKLVVWPDASMGCPQPEMMYIQVPQDGCLIQLQVEEEVFEYHSGGHRMPFLCEEPAPRAAPAKDSDSDSD